MTGFDMPALFGRFAAALLCLSVLAATSPPAEALKPGKQVTVLTFDDEDIVITDVVYVELAAGRLGVAWKGIGRSGGQTVDLIQFRTANLKSGQLSPILTVYRDRRSEQQPISARLEGARLLANGEIQVLFTDGTKKSAKRSDLNVFERRIRGTKLASPVRKLRSIASSDVSFLPSAFAVRQFGETTVLLERADAFDLQAPFAIDVTLFQQNGSLAKASQRQLTAETCCADANPILAARSGLKIAMLNFGKPDPATGDFSLIGSVMTTRPVDVDVKDVVVLDASSNDQTCGALVPSIVGFHLLTSLAGEDGVLGRSFTDALVPDGAPFSLDVFNVSDACNVLPSKNDGFLLAHDDERRDGIVVFEFAGPLFNFKQLDRVFIRHPATRRGQFAVSKVALELANGDVVVDQRVFSGVFTSEGKIIVSLIDRE